MATRINFPQRIEARKASAKVRQEAYNKLTTVEKLAKAKVGSREYTKLMAKVLVNSNFNPDAQTSTVGFVKYKK